ncbi:hypothetical protein J4450_04645 [Candidatus Micrarchaeota archaeon]|nr:hypothetical protein [Candidatus Micrarchaeota archaeon]
MAGLAFQRIGAALGLKRTDHTREQLQQLRNRTRLIFGSDALREVKTLVDRECLEGVRAAIKKQGIVSYCRAQNSAELEHAEGVQRLYSQLNSILGTIPENISSLSERKLFAILHSLVIALEGLEHTILDLRISPLRGVDEHVASALVRVIGVMILDTESKIEAIKGEIKTKTGIDLNINPIIE